MADPKADSERQPARSVGPEESGHRVKSPSHADAKKGDAAAAGETGAGEADRKPG